MYRLIENIRAGRLSLGTMAKGGPNLVQHVASAGLDFLIVDMMHSSVDWTELSHVAWKSRAEGLYPFVRLPANPWGAGAAMPDRRFPVDAERAFACGAEGLVWSVASAADARMMVHMAGDPHVGAPVTDAAQQAQATERAGSVRLLLPLVESLGALDEIEDILSIDGISGAFIGCSDLAQVLGHDHAALDGEVPVVFELAPGFANSPEGQRSRARIPMGRVGRENELEGALLLLASDASSYMSGSEILVDGASAAGRTA